MGNQPNESSWGYVITIIVLALLFVLVLPVLGFLYIEIHQDRIIMESNIKRIEKLKKEIELEREKSKE